MLVTVREAHPGARVGQPETADAKHKTARLLRAHHGADFQIAVDDIDGTHHRAFGTRPSSAYLIDPDGTIRFRAHWSNLTGDIDEAITATIAGRARARSALGGTMRAMAAMTGNADSAFDSAGPGAMGDTWRAAPPFGMMIVVSRLFGFLPPRSRGAAAMGVLGVATVAIAVVAVTLLL